MRRGFAPTAVILSAVLALAACGGPPVRERPKQQLTGRNDINFRPSDQLRVGGTFQWPLDALPDNWNFNQADGNSLDTLAVIGAIEPTLFVAGQDGTVGVNRDYLTSAEVVSADPQVVLYRLNQNATWSNGRSLDWTDLRAQWQALNGRDGAYQAGSTSGYDRIERVERGSTDDEIRVTFNRRFAEWRGLFGPLYPKELNSSPAEFNRAWADRAPITGGPFRVDRVDTAGKTVSLRRSPDWWGRPVHLDSIVFKVVDRPGRAEALASGAIDFFDANGSADLIARAETMPDVVRRDALTPDTYHLTTNGGPGRLLADQTVRLAVLKAVDRTAIARAEIGRLTPEARPAGNHFYPQGSANYADNSGQLAFDPEQARRELDAAGWRLTGQSRSKGGQQLKLSFLIPSDTPTSKEIAQLVQQQLATIGVQVVVNTVPSGDFGAKHLNLGDFDLTTFRWLQTPFPLSDHAAAYQLDPKQVRQNPGRVGSREVNDLYEEALGELDEVKRIELTQHIDRKLWRLGGEITLYQVPGVVEVRSSVANFGAFGFAQFPIDYAAIGFVA